MSNKKDELKLRNPDQFQQRIARLLGYLVGNTKLAAGLVIGLFVIFGAYFAADYYMQTQDQEVMASLAEIDKLYQDELEAANKKKQELQDQIDRLKSEQEASKAGKNAAKIAELEAELAAKQPDHSGSKPKFLAFYEQHPDAAAGQLAGIRYSALAFADRELDQAKKVLSQVHAKAKPDDLILWLQSGLLLISVYEDASELDQAVSVADGLLKNVGDELEPRVLLAKGRLLALKDDKEAALGVLNQILEKHKLSQEAENAQSLKALLY